VGYWRNTRTLCQHAIEATEGNYIALDAMVDLLCAERRPQEAEAYALKGLEVAPLWLGLNDKLLAILADQKRYQDALDHCERTLRLAESMRSAFHQATLHCHAADLLGLLGRGSAATYHYREALRLQPALAQARNNLAWLLATHPDPQLRNGPEAIRLAEEACRQTESKDPVFLGTLAAAYAEAGRFADAVSMAEQARRLADAAGLKQIVERNGELLQLYRAGQAYHQPPPVESSKP
jgi:tetratricopeptide (TPR) repeat protein